MVRPLVDTADEVREATIGFLKGFSVVPVDDEVALRAVEIRRAHKIRLPDAIIWASAQVHGMILVTRNTKDFPENDPGVRVPYLL